MSKSAQAINAEANTIQRFRMEMAMNHLNKWLPTGRTSLRRFVLFCIVLMSPFNFTACEAKNPEMVTGLSVEVLNYSQESIAYVMLNGTKVSGGIHKAKIGGVEGGGASCCGGVISAIKKTATVTVEAEHGAYTTQAEVELPFPDIMDKLIVHVLPGRKVVLEVTPGDFFPRQDLMDAQIKVLGLKKEHVYTGPLRARPKYTGYYKPD